MKNQLVDERVRDENLSGSEDNSATIFNNDS